MDTVNVHSMADAYGPFELPALGWRDDDPLLLPYDVVRGTQIAMYGGKTAEAFLTERVGPGPWRRIPAGVAARIRVLYRSGEYTRRDLAVMFGLGLSSVSMILGGFRERPA